MQLCETHKRAYLCWYEYSARSQNPTGTRGEKAPELNCRPTCSRPRLAADRNETRSLHDAYPSTACSTPHPCLETKFIWICVGRQWWEKQAERREMLWKIYDNYVMGCIDASYLHDLLSTSSSTQHPSPLPPHPVPLLLLPTTLLTSGGLKMEWSSSKVSETGIFCVTRLTHSHPDPAARAGTVLRVPRCCT